MGRFDGRVALLTGAASGIGRATALRLAADGATIAGFDRDGEGLAAVVQEVADAGGRMTTTVGDVSIRESCVAAVEEAVEAHGRLDCWPTSPASAGASTWRTPPRSPGTGCWG
jgi:NAD(P)-dependent dehydrogenase (short-subunit alcohol dehydrogenase family)